MLQFFKVVEHGSLFAISNVHRRGRLDLNKSIPLSLISNKSGLLFRSIKTEYLYGPFWHLTLDGE